MRKLMVAMRVMGLLACLALLVGALAGAPALAQPAVGMIIVPTPATVQVGDTFTVDVVVTIDGGQQVDTAQAYIDFNPTLLQVQSMTPGPAMGNVLPSGWNNTAGTVDYAAGVTFGAVPPTDDFVLVSIEFQAMAQTAGTPLTLVFQFPLRMTDAFSVGLSVLNPFLVVNGNVVINAPLYDLTVNASPPEGGVVTGTGTYPGGTDAPVSATANDCYEFVNWTGDVADPGNATTTVNVDGDKTVTANFAKILYTLTVNSGEGGTVVTPGEGEFVRDCCTWVDLVALPDVPCWYFVGWTGDVEDPDNAITRVHVDGNKTVTAEFARYRYTLTTDVSPAGGGTVTGAGEYDCCTTVPIEATPADECWYFVNWTGNVAEPNQASTTAHLVYGNETVTANFAKVQYDLTTNADPPEGGTVTGGGTYDCCEWVWVEAIPADPCWYFTGWGGDLDGVTDNPAEIHIDGNKTVTAHFAKYRYTLTTLASPGGNGTVTGGGEYDCCTYAPIEAIAGNCYRFDSWTGPVTDAGNATTTVHIDGNVTVTANFVPVTDLEGQVNLQGRPPAPWPSWITPLTVVLYQPGTANIVDGPYNVNTDQWGAFTVPGLDIGTYDIGIKCRRSLGRLAGDVVLGGCAVQVDFGTLLEGDANDDDFVSGADYSLLYSYFGQTTAVAVEACDFNRDGFVGGADYSLLYTNFGLVGEMPLWPIP